MSGTLKKNLLEADNTLKIAIIGVGYVGLPLALEFSKYFEVTAFDTELRRIQDLSVGYDITKEIEKKELQKAKNLKFTSIGTKLKGCDVFIVTVPTPLAVGNFPDLGHVKAACKLVGNVMAPGAYIIFESTVYPGATEEECIPILEDISGLSCNKDFFVGYSPERINPGDKSKSIADIVKVTSGSNPDATVFIDSLYKRIIKAGTHPVSSIKVAEASKVIENTQRDINIALVNELSVIFEKLQLDTNEVIDASSTKWNFIDFRPGLVGGHCIGIDPYYLTFRAEQIGIYSQLVLAGRRVNNAMPEHVVSVLLKKMLQKKINISGSKILVMGVTFKENCPDTRNSKVFEVIQSLDEYGLEIEWCDPWIEDYEAKKIKKWKRVVVLPKNYYDSIIVAVPHKNFLELGAEEINSFAKPNSVVFDLKAMLDQDESDLRL